MMSRLAVPLVCACSLLLVTGCITTQSVIITPPKDDNAALVSRLSVPMLPSAFISGSAFYKDASYDIPLQFTFLNDGKDRRRISVKDGILGALIADIIMISNSINADVPYLRTNFRGSMTSMRFNIPFFENPAALMPLMQLTFIDTNRSNAVRSVIATNGGTEVIVDYEKFRDTIAVAPNGSIQSFTRTAYNSEFTAQFRDYTSESPLPRTVILTTKKPRTELRLHLDTLLPGEHLIWKDAQFR
ncbi:MAG: hypothetical protein HZC28_16040 [Spirochaetes bacterium]|nr:hypothetical protein [Spirochaetota bacterium]